MPSAIPNAARRLSKVALSNPSRNPCKLIAMRIDRALLIAALLALSAPALALEAPSASPSPASESKGSDLRPLKPAPDEDVSVSSMRLLAPGIGWAEISVSRDSSDSSDQVYYWTTDNGAHWKNITPHAPRKQELADFFFLDTHRGWAIFNLPAEEQDHPQTRMPLTLAATTNAGATWSKTPVTLRLKDYLSKDTLSELEIDVTRIAFADPLHGWLQLALWIGMHGHASLLLVTSDGGKTWKEADSYPGPNSSDMVLVTPDEGWVFGTVEPDGTPNSLFVTRDGTKNWQELSAQPITNLGDVKEWHEMLLRPGGVLDAEGADCEVHRLPMFQDAVHGFLEEDCAVDVSMGDLDSMHTTVLFATNDAGRTWKPNRTLTNFVGQCNSSTMVGASWIAPVMKAGHIALVRVAAGSTVDAGAENGSISRYSLCQTSLSFVSLTRGWMLLTDKGTLRSTVDGGRTWTTLTPGRNRR